MTSSLRKVAMPVADKPETLKCGRFTLSLKRPLIMGVVNVTPDSFSDGGRFFDAERAIAHAQQLVQEGADILDVGGESSRPGADPIPLAEERRRVMGVVEKLVGLGVPVSIDTYKPEVMREAIVLGASMVNDIFALRTEGAVDAVAGADVAVCLMHMQGEPKNMQEAPGYRDVVSEVSAFLLERARVLAGRGFGRDRIVLDPGFGFGKTPQHNVELLRGLPSLASMGFPVLVGLSRKSLLGRITRRPATGGRLHASVASALIAAQKGASIVRVHDVAATRDALLVWQAIEGNGDSLLEEG